METPPLVLRALALAESLGFEKSCQPEDGALLHVLAACRGITRAAEIGTGAGVGAAWIVSALPPQTPFFSAETDPTLAARAGELFAADPNVTILVGPWEETLPPEAPFDLLFADGGGAQDDIDGTLSLLAPGGMAVLDDFSFDPALPDPHRDAWMLHPKLTTIELWVTRERRALVSVRR